MVEQSDNVIWAIIGTNFCSYKVNTVDESVKFCKNPYNSTGRCDRKSCPLANSDYATVRLYDDKLVLHVKNREMQHCPAKTWNSIDLPNDNVEESCKIIEKELENHSKFLIEKCKLRVTRYSEWTDRKIQIESNPLDQKILLPKKDKVLRREKSREKRALKVSRLEQQIEKELIERLKIGVYGDIYNIDERQFNKVLDKKGYQQTIDEDYEYVADEEEEEEIQESINKKKTKRSKEDFVPSDQDIEDVIPSLSTRKSRKNVEVEYEEAVPMRLLVNKSSSFSKKKK